MASASEVLGPDGALAQRIEGFQAREGQRRMADAVFDALRARSVLIAEAGTGTGKTFAYLVPALLSGRKVVISTGTKTLQDQLYAKDLPLVRDALEAPVRMALLKGRSNYLCLYRMEQTALEGRFDSPEQASHFQRVQQWSSITTTGDLAEMPGGVSDLGLRTRVSSTADNCLGQDCPLYGDCFLMEARRRAQEADVLVVNHHLLLADWALKEGGFGEVLPQADAFILDEAHQLPDVAAQFFGVSISSRQINDLVRDVKLAYFEEAGDMPDVLEAADAVTRSALDLRLALGHVSRRAAWSEVAEEETVHSALQHLIERLEVLETVLGPLAERGKGLENAAKRTVKVQEALVAFALPDSGDAVQWFETYTQSFILRITPLDVAQNFRGHMERHPAAWVFTSATLSVDKKFGHFKSRLGIGDADTLSLESPFDYAHNALLYIPRALPYPNSSEYLQAFLDASLPVLQASGGRAFLLFTSYRALNYAADYLAQRLPYPLLVQGETSQNVLLERFRELGNAVLLGTSSFWEGVDVRGEALSCVIIDRLPFASPSDPVMQAKIDALRRKNGNPFMNHQLPLAVIALRQGVGRLIRDTADRGVLMIGDNRLVHKPYGKTFLNSLPAMPVTRSLETVEDFFTRANAESA